MDRNTELTHETTDALVKILSHEELMPLWSGILDEVTRAMKEVERLEAEEGKRDAADMRRTEQAVVEWLQR